MRVGMSLSPTEVKISNFPHGMAKWLGAHYNQEVRFICILYLYLLLCVWVRVPKKWKFSNFPHHLWLLLSDYNRGETKWFEAHYNQEVHFSSAVRCKNEPQVLTSLLNLRPNYYYYCNIIEIESVICQKVLCSVNCVFLSKDPSVRVESIVASTLLDSIKIYVSEMWKLSIYLILSFFSGAWGVFPLITWTLRSIVMWPFVN